MGRLSEMLVHAGSGFQMICAQKEERILPASVIRDFVNDKVTKLEEEHGRKASKREREEIKDQVLLELTPKAFTRSTRTWGLISPKQDLLILDAASPKKADEFTELLRKSLDHFSLVIPQVKQAPASVFTQWLSGDLRIPDDLDIGDECELVEPTEEGGIVRCRRQDLTSEEIKAHLDAGKQAVKVGVIWNEKLTCVLADDLSVKKLRFSDELIEEAANQGEADAAAQFDADFTLMSLELARFVPRLFKLFGGLEEDKV
jgi:recombination associated protein RdgC